jgi:hypothetical protein
MHVEVDINSRTRLETHWNANFLWLECVQRTTESGPGDVVHVVTLYFQDLATLTRTIDTLTAMQRAITFP